jgi:hypothetical protein
MNPQPKICINCKWWTPWPAQPNPKMIVGDCRRHAPQLFQNPQQPESWAPGNAKKESKPFVTKFPSTRSDEFCGSFKPRIEATESGINAKFQAWWQEVRRLFKSRFGYELERGDATGFEAYFDDGMTPEQALDADNKQPAQS